MEVKVNGIYRHFKGNIYKIIAIGKHSETLEEYVVYASLKDGNDVWIRPINMFWEKVDKIKYPNVKQEYRFEEIK